jgi:hypothetical protein
MRENTEPVQFSNLPLHEVTVACRFVDQIEITSQLLRDVEAELMSDGFQVIRFKGGQAPAFSFTLNAEDGIDLQNTEAGLDVRLNTTQSLVTWRLTSHAPYPRFDKLSRVTRRLVDSMGRPSVSIVTLSYLNIDSSGLPLAKLLNMQGVAPEWLDRVVEFNVARKVDERLEYRIVVSPPGESGRLIQTVGGVKIMPEEDVFIALEEKCHRPMQHFFLQILTPDALALWGYEEAGKHDGL